MWFVTYSYPTTTSVRKNNHRSKYSLNNNPYSTDEIAHDHRYQHPSRHQHCNYYIPYENTLLQPPVSFPVPHYPLITSGRPELPYWDTSGTPGEDDSTHLPPRGQHLVHPQPPYPAQQPFINPPLQSGPDSISRNLDRGFARGRKKIGINYFGQKWMLRRCVDDARRVRKFLIDYHGFPKENIVLLTDSGSRSHEMPTKQNILNAMSWLVRGARRVSGHGGQVKDLDGDEYDGWDEAICPVDYQSNGRIIDDYMHAIMVKHLPEGCRLTALLDSCHSGTALDLPYIYSTSGRLKYGHPTIQEARRKARADVVSSSACKDGQLTKDIRSPDGSAFGAMTHAFISILKEKWRLTYKELSNYLRDQLQSNDNQKPQLSASHRIDTNDIFTI